MDHFLIRLWHETKSGFYMTTGNDKLSGWTKKKLQNTSQSQTYTKKMSRSLFDCLLAIWPTTAFWILVKPLHLRSMLSKSMRCPENCNNCSQHWSIERAQCFSTITPDHISHNQHFKSWTNLGYKFCLLCIFTWPLIYRLSLLQASWLFLQGKMHPQPARVRKCFPRVHQIPKHECLCFKNKQTFLLGENVVIIVPILNNKDVFESSYNDLKFTVLNHNYFCTNLILWFITGYWISFSVLYSRTFLLLCPIYSSLYLLIKNSNLSSPNPVPLR